MHARASELIASLDLQPHPEGGWYRETWRTGSATTAHGSRSAATGIIYLLAGTQVSAPHRVAHDELWAHHEGAVLEVIRDGPDGALCQRLGPVDQAGTQPQLVVPGGQWFGARLCEPSYALVSCVVAPGFDFADFELADQQAQLSTELRALTDIT